MADKVERGPDGRPTWKWAERSARFETGEYLSTCGDFGGVSTGDGLKACPAPAGNRTEHPGYGRCGRHKGNSPAEVMKAVVLMGHALGRELQVTPMEAMLRSVRVAAAQAAWYDLKVSEAPDDDAVAPGGSHYHWVVAGKEAHRASVSFSAVALRSGLAKILVEQVTQQAMALAPVLEMLLGTLEEYAPAEVVAQSRLRLRQMLLELDSLDWGSERQPAIEGGSEDG